MEYIENGRTRAKYSNGIMIGKLKDKRDIMYILTEYQNTLNELQNKRGDIKKKPLSSLEYKKYIGGIDRHDQLMSYFPYIRKTLFWYEKFLR